VRRHFKYSLASTQFSDILQTHITGVGSHHLTGRDFDLTELLHLISDPIAADLKADSSTVTERNPVLHREHSFAATAFRTTGRHTGVGSHTLTGRNIHFAALYIFIAFWDIGVGSHSLTGRNFGFFSEHHLANTDINFVEGITGVGSHLLTGRATCFTIFDLFTGAVHFGVGSLFLTGRISCATVFDHFTSAADSTGVGSHFLTGRDCETIAVSNNFSGVGSLFECPISNFWPSETPNPYSKNSIYWGGLPFPIPWPEDNSTHTDWRTDRFDIWQFFAALFAFGFFSLLLAKAALEGQQPHWYWHKISTTFLGQTFWTQSATRNCHHCRSGPKSRHSFAYRLTGIGLLLLLGMTDIHNTRWQNCWGEGCDPSMGVTEVFDNATTWTWPRTKQHGQQPQMCNRTQLGPDFANRKSKVEKRSIQRAYRRSLRLGSAWYRGQHYSSTDFERMGCRPNNTPVAHTPISPGLQHDWEQCHKHHSAKKRIQFWQWNCGGLAIPKLDEVKAWLAMNHIDVAILVETRMQFDSEWSDATWNILHSGEGPNRGKGIMILISKRLCRSSQIKWQNHVGGRLVHVRLNLPTRPLDVVACYQHTFQPNQSCLHNRDIMWTKIDNVLQGIPNRNGLILLGDFNSALQQTHGLIGHGTFHWKGKETTGRIHSDHGRFLNILRGHALVVLNSWDKTLGPTYVHGDQASRLDYACVRQPFADSLAKQVRYLWQSPFIQQTTHGHVPILCSIARHWIPENRQTSIQQVTMQQRQAGRLAYLAQTPEWQVFTQQSQQCLNQHLGDFTADVDNTLDQMHKEVMRLYCKAFPSGKAARATPAWKAALPTILNKWDHRRQILRPRACSTRNIFHAWFHVARFCQLRRSHRKQARCIRQTQFAEVVQTAEQAARQHDTHKLFQVINRFAPKQPRKQIQLRNHAGHMATPLESAAIVNKFVADTWHGPPCMNLKFDRPPGVPFTVDQLAKALSLIPSTRATARPFAPGVVWRQHAKFLAPLIHARLREWWSFSPPIIPASWRHGWLFLIPKPLKPPVSPGNLRPLALQEPVGKAIIGLLIHLAMQEAKQHLTLYPIWAYLENRSTLEAIRRVCSHCEHVRRLVKMHRSTPHTRAQAHPRSGLYGGLQLCLDLQRAFDCVDRCRLFSKLSLLGINPAIIQLLTTWHEHMMYIVQHDPTESSIPVGRGVRQGCKAAPGLWCFFLVIFFHELQKDGTISLHWIQEHITIYADDCHLGACFSNLEEFLELHRIIGMVFSTFSLMDMHINPNKSVAIMELKGSQSGWIRRQFICKRQDADCLKITVPEYSDVHIPISQTAKYLGVVISYGNFEAASVKHRLSLTRIGYRRLQKWLTGKHCLTTAQRYRLWQTCIYPIFSYGVFAMCLPSNCIHTAITQLTLMLRKLAHDHSYITRRTNEAALAFHRLPCPTQLLHGTAVGLLRTVTARQHALLPHDIAHSIQWSHLPELISRLESMQATASLERLAPPTLEANLTTPFFQCAKCDFCTADVSSFRRHCTTHHNHATYRTCFAKPADFALDGLPTCKFCHTEFTTWRMFVAHIERGCQAIHSGPTSCTLETSRAGAALGSIEPMQSQLADAAARGLRLITDAELHNLKQQRFGANLLQIVQDRNWERVATDQEACQYLASRCIICSFQFSRCQELHQHYRLNHPELWEHAPQKGIQLTNLFSTDSPCTCCGALFLTHMCPTWSQIAVLLVNGAGVDTSDIEPITDVRQRCDLCLEFFSTPAKLVQHLQEAHGLQGLGFNVSRDSLDNHTACAHCGTLFQTMGGLKSHIVQGRCQFFNPQAATETIDIDPLWREACLDGRFLEILKPPGNRLRLTVVCQACGKGCKRAADLSLHLQTAHARLWRQSQRLTQVLVDIFYQQQCFCNPSTGLKRGHHICLPFRQLAMCFHRLACEPFAPTVITDQTLQATLSDKLPRSDRYIIEQALVHRQFKTLWQETAPLKLLRQQCLFCGARPHTADLALHLREEHACQHAFFLFYMEQLLPSVHAMNPDDFQCHLCGLIFNLPAHMCPDEPLHDRAALVISHLRGSCPVLIQLALLFGSLLNGATLQHGTCRHGGHDPDHGQLRSPGTVVPNAGQVTETEPQSTADQGPSKRRTLQPRRRDGSTARRTTPTNNATAEHSGSTGTTTRPGVAKPSKDGSIHSFLSPEQMGALHIMIQETAQWKSQMEAQNQGHLMPLRQHLMLALLNSLRTRAGQIVESKETDQLYEMSLKKGVILADRSFPYHRWDPATQKLVLDKKPPISYKKMEQHLDELQEMMQEKELIARFHALRGFNASSQNAVPWRLQIHMRRDRAYELLYQLSHNSVWMAVGASMKPHTMGQSPLATALQAMTQEQKTKPKGKGKGKHKATKQEP